MVPKFLSLHHNLLDALKIYTLRQSLEDTKLVEAKEKCPYFYNYFISSFFIIGCFGGKTEGQVAMLLSLPFFRTERLKTCHIFVSMFFLLIRGILHTLV